MGAREVPAGTLASILRQAGLSRDEFEAVVKGLRLPAHNRLAAGSTPVGPTFVQHRVNRLRALLGEQALKNIQFVLISFAALTLATACTSPEPATPPTATRAPAATPTSGDSPNYRLKS